MKYSEEKLKDLMKTSGGEQIKLFFDEKASELRNIDNMKTSLNPIRDAIEIRATKKAFKILIKILNELCDFEEETPEKPQMPNY